MFFENKDCSPCECSRFSLLSPSLYFVLHQGDFVCILHSTKIQPVKHDALVWRTKHRVFSIRPFTRTLSRATLRVGKAYWGLKLLLNSSWLRRNLGGSNQRNQCTIFSFIVPWLLSCGAYYVDVMGGFGNDSTNEWFIYFLFLRVTLVLQIPWGLHGRQSAFPLWKGWMEQNRRSLQILSYCLVSWKDECSFPCFLR